MEAFLVSFRQTSERGDQNGSVSELVSGKPNF